MNIGRHRNVILVYEHRLRHWRFLGKKIITSELKTSLNIQLGPEYPAWTWLSSLDLNIKDLKLWYLIMCYYSFRMSRIWKSYSYIIWLQWPQTHLLLKARYILLLFSLSVFLSPYVLSASFYVSLINIILWISVFLIQTNLSAFKLKSLFLLYEVRSLIPSEWLPIILLYCSHLYWFYLGLFYSLFHHIFETNFQIPLLCLLPLARMWHTLFLIL